MYIKLLYDFASLKRDFNQSEEYKRLNEDQRAFFKAFFEGRNMLLTGAAGTGKSFCLDSLFRFMDRKGVFIGKAALTGVAALNIVGSTIHSWAGLGLADEDTAEVVKKALSNKKARERMQKTNILFIDEISMASADLLEKLDATLRSARGSKEPFGGMMMIFSGDFFQLPPVFKGLGAKLEFAFKSPVWKNADIQTIHLTKLVRQDESTQFAQLLQNIRFGNKEGIELLDSRIDAKLNLPFDPIKIFCKNIDIDAYNKAKYDNIDGIEQIYVKKDAGNPMYEKFFDKNCQAPPVLRLKIGTQVMLLANIDTEHGLVNGKIGKVDGFSPLGPIVKFTDGQRAIVESHKWEVKEQEVDIAGKMRYKVVASRTQIPLKYAWATSVHKQQGQTLDHAEIDLSAAFEYGQVYVALSRVKTLEGISLKAFDPRKIKAHPDCVEFYNSIKNK